MHERSDLGAYGDAAEIRRSAPYEHMLEFLGNSIPELFELRNPFPIRAPKLKAEKYSRNEGERPEHEAGNGFQWNAKKAQHEYASIMSSGGGKRVLPSGIAYEKPCDAEVRGKRLAVVRNDR